MTFNETSLGYLFAALDYAKVTEETKRKVIRGYYYSLDILTMSEAREIFTNH